MRAMLKSGALVLLFLITSACNTGLDRLRFEADIRDWQLANACASGWFSSKQFTPEQEQLVNVALQDWATRLAADAQLLGVDMPKELGR